MDGKIKIEKRVIEPKEKMVFITTDNKEFESLLIAESHQKRVNQKEKEEKKFKDFLETFNVERRPCSLEAITTLITYSPYNGYNNTPQDKDAVNPTHNEVSYQWFNIKNEEEKDKIERYYKLFFYIRHVDLRRYNGWTLIVVWNSVSEYDSIGCSIYSLEEYEKYIKDLTDSLPY